MTDGHSERIEVDSRDALRRVIEANKKVVPLELPVGAVQLLYDVLGHFPHDPEGWATVARARCSVTLMTSARQA